VETLGSAKPRCAGSIPASASFQMKLTVKKTNDTASALEVAQNSRDYFETGFDQLKKDLNNHNLFGAFLEGEMVGFITYKTINPDVIEISWLAVLPQHRKQGVGSKLVNVSLHKLEGKHKICEVKTLASTHKDKGYAKTRKFYKKLGFISLEIIHPYPGWDDDSPCQIFVKPIK
jgi:ribosomal protein S18 acetylase RimI-like enzyme